VRCGGIERCYVCYVVSVDACISTLATLVLLDQ
jgi:hypothetical protein